jgi:hypothetical protein
MRGEHGGSTVFGKPTLTTAYLWRQRRRRKDYLRHRSGVAIGQTLTQIIFSPGFH